MLAEVVLHVNNASMIKGKSLAHNEVYHHNFIDDKEYWSWQISVQSLHTMLIQNSEDG